MNANSTYYSLLVSMSTSDVGCRKRVRVGKHLGELLWAWPRASAGLIDAAAPAGPGPHSTCESPPSGPTLGSAGGTSEPQA